MSLGEMTNDGYTPIRLVTSCCGGGGGVTVVTTIQPEHRMLLSRLVA
ncbi:MAG TPA: hypothetical protein VE244_02055 [Nitrososphaeraceae archaeon]|nr:hypothetical protein [Nitrososphaeraceae archaeon]